MRTTTTVTSGLSFESVLKRILDLVELLWSEDASPRWGEGDQAVSKVAQGWALVPVYGH
jgi:hypothetical protein